MWRIAAVGPFRGRDVEDPAQPFVFTCDVAELDQPAVIGIGGDQLDHRLRLVRRIGRPPAEPHHVDAVIHGPGGDIGRGVRAVVLERAAGQIALTVFGAGALLILPSPVRDQVRSFAPLAVAGLAGACAVVVAIRMNRAPGKRGGALRATLAEGRRALLSRRNGPGVALSSAVILAGHVVMFVVAARVAGSAASVAALTPIAVLALVAMGLPLNVGGWGPREGVTAWAFAAAGLGADRGLATAVVYGVLSFVAALPGLVVLVVRWYAGMRYPRAEVSSSKTAPKESARLARSSFPFSADPREGRPMTPDSV